MMVAILLVLVILSAVLPIPYVATMMPACWILQDSLIRPDSLLMTSGSMNLRVVDILILMLLARTLLVVVREKKFVLDIPLYAAITLFFAVNLLASMAAGIKFGDAQLMRGLTSLIRLGAEIAVLPVIALTVTTKTQAKRCLGFVIALLAVLALIQFINFFGASHGVVIGEVQGLERGRMRYFGPVGDSIGMVLLLGYALALCFGNLPGVALFGGGILLTAGLNAIMVTAVATLLFLLLGWRTAHVQACIQRNLVLLPLFAIGAVILGVLFFKPLAKPVLDRLDSGSAATSGKQRLASATMAGRMIADNPVLGIGYMGFESALPRYGGGQYFDLNRRDGGTANTNNQFLQILTDSGIAGLLAFAIMMLCAARLILIITRRKDDAFLSTFYLGVFIWFCAMGLGNQASVWLVPSSYIGRLLWTVLGTAVALDQCMPEELTEPAEKTASNSATI